MMARPVTSFGRRHRSPHVGPLFWTMLLVVAAVSLPVEPAAAHGERNQEPFLRMRTIHWYDMSFSEPDGSVLQVNDELVITGKFRLFSSWPEQIPPPDMLYMNTVSAGSVFTKVEAWVNGKAAIQSFRGQLGRDYEFKLVLKARWEGKWHVHPMVNVRDAGGLIGPGIFVTVAGSYKDFVQTASTIPGLTIDNLSSFGTMRVYAWHVLWAVIALFWLLWWIRRPLLIPRYLMTKDGNYEEKLITRTDQRVAVTLLIVVLVLTIGSAMLAEKQYPRTIPLQAGVAIIPPLPEAPSVGVDMLDGRYFIPGRTVIAKMRVTNTSERPIRLGEFTSANLRFLDRTVAGVDDGTEDNFPQDLIANAALEISDNSPLAPGESRVISLEATDAAWELERLSSLLDDPDSTLGALLFFYDDAGNRYISELFGSMIPVFKKT